MTTKYVCEPVGATFGNYKAVSGCFWCTHEVECLIETARRRKIARKVKQEQELDDVVEERLEHKPTRRTLGKRKTLGRR